MGVLLTLVCNGILAVLAFAVGWQPFSSVNIVAEALDLGFHVAVNQCVRLNIDQHV